MNKNRTKAPPFLKIKHSEQAQKDAAHVRYIGSRPGVEKVLVQDDLAADAAHIEYAGARPRSTGLFGPDPQRLPLLAEAMREVGNRDGGPSWRLVLSLREDDARELGVSGLAAWQDLTRRCMAQFGQATGIRPEYLRWVAAHHPEPGHPHVHVIAWLADGAPRRRGLLSTLELREVRRGMTRELFGPLRARLAAERTMNRNTMLDTVREDVARAERLLRRVELELQAREPVGERLPPRLERADLELLARQLEGLAQKMPGHGQAKLAYLPAEIKEEAREVARWLLERPQVAGVLASYEKATRELTRLYTRQPEKAEEAWRKAYDDLRDRVAQVVVRAAAELNRTSRWPAATQERSVEERPKPQVQDRAELPAGEAGLTRQPHSSKGIDLARATWRSAWRALEREHLRAEARAELASLREVERAEERARRERERQGGGLGRL